MNNICFLQKERMEQTFEYEIDFDSDYDNWPCRKLMLQPFVENSIFMVLKEWNWRKNSYIAGTDIRNS